MTYSQGTVNKSNKNGRYPSYSPKVLYKMSYSTCFEVIDDFNFTYVYIHLRIK